MKYEIGDLKEGRILVFNNSEPKYGIIVKDDYLTDGLICIYDNGFWSKIDDLEEEFTLYKLMPISIHPFLIFTSLIVSGLDIEHYVENRKLEKVGKVLLTKKDIAEKFGLEVEDFEIVEDGEFQSRFHIKI